MKLKRVWDVLNKEGIPTFVYLVNEKLKQKKSEAKKYEAYIKKCEPYLNKQLLNNNESRNQLFEIINFGCNDALVQIQESRYSYIGLVAPFVKSSETSVQHIGAYLNYLKSKNHDCCFVYTDEDFLDEKSGKRCNPRFKPDYSPDTILSYNYIGGFWCAKKELITEALKGQIIDEIQADKMLLYEALMLRVLLNCPAHKVYHLKGVYFHCCKEFEYSRQYLQKLSMVKEKLLAECDIDAKVISEGDGLPVQHVVYQWENEPKVSIIIPSKDNPDLLKQCLSSIEKNTAYENYEVIVVDNGSINKHRLEYEAMLEAFTKPTVYHYEAMEFNFSKMCNIGTELSSGQYYLFLNDDVEVLSTKYEHCDWIRVMLGQAMQSHVGAVGAKLLYPDSALIQHIGVVNYESGPSHIFSKADDTEVLKDYRNRADYNYLCVTAACMLVDAQKFKEVKGFSEALAVTFNDVEFCMKLMNAGYYQSVRNDVRLYHHESITRGDDAADEEKFKRHLRELQKLHELHPHFVQKDSFYSPLLVQNRLDSSLNTNYNNVLDAGTDYSSRNVFEKSEGSVKP